MAKHANGPKCAKCQEMMYESLLDGSLREWFEDLQKNENDVHIANAYRNKKDQDKAYNDGFSKAKFGESPHNYLPCLAMDLFFLKDGKYALFINRLKSIAENAPADVRWGGNWSGGFKDNPHFEKLGWKSEAKDFPKGNKK